MHEVKYVASEDSPDKNLSFLLLLTIKIDDLSHSLAVTHNYLKTCILLMQCPNFTKNGTDGHQDSLSKHAKSH